MTNLGMYDLFGDSRTDNGHDVRLSLSLALIRHTLCGGRPSGDRGPETGTLAGTGMDRGPGTGPLVGTGADQGPYGAVVRRTRPAQ